MCVRVKDAFVYVLLLLVPLPSLSKQSNAVWYSYLPRTLTWLWLPGIVLKMADPIRIGSLPGQMSISDNISKGPSKTLIIPAKELVQITAKVQLCFLSILLITLLHSGFQLSKVKFKYLRLLVVEILLKK